MLSVHENRGDTVPGRGRPWVSVQQENGRSVARVAYPQRRVTHVDALGPEPLEHPVLLCGSRRQKRGPARDADQASVTHPEVCSSLAEDADAAGTYEQPHDDEDDAPQELLADDGEDSGNDQDYGQDPKQRCHDLLSLG